MKVLGEAMEHPRREALGWELKRLANDLNREAETILRGDTAPIYSALRLAGHVGAARSVLAALEKL